MDPNLFHLNAQVILEVLSMIVVLAFFLERALAVLFESRFFIEITESGAVLSEMKQARGQTLKKGLEDKPKWWATKEIIVIVTSIAICWIWHFDALSIILASTEVTNIVGYIITGLIISGGSKASIALFKDVLKFMSSAERERIDAKQRISQP